VAGRELVFGSYVFCFGNVFIYSASCIFLCCYVSPLATYTRSFDGINNRKTNLDTAFT
jgi:hypothetical protein